MLAQAIGTNTEFDSAQCLGRFGGAIRSTSTRLTDRVSVIILAGAFHPFVLLVQLLPRLGRSSPNVYLCALGGHPKPAIGGQLKTGQR